MLTPASQRQRLHIFGEQTSADEPVRLAGGLTQFPLLDEDSEHIGERFVEGPGLPLIGQASLVLCNPMRQFMADDTEALGESLEDDPVAIPVNHLHAVPEGVVIIRCSPQ
jgi:hypothetical protein